MPTLLQPGAIGTARVEHFTVSKRDADLYNMPLRWKPGTRYDEIDPGTYAKLFVDGKLVMSDTTMERWTNWEALRRANGHVLIGGLGLGMIVHAMLWKSDVQTVTVLEQSADVVALVQPSFATHRHVQKLSIITADVFTWAIPNGAKWDTIYMDIWPDVVDDNVDGYNRLVPRFSPRLNRSNPNAWMGGWRIEELRQRRRADRNSFYGL